MQKALKHWPKGSHSKSQPCCTANFQAHHNPLAVNQYVDTHTTKVQQKKVYPLENEAVVFITYFDCLVIHAVGLMLSTDKVFHHLEENVTIQVMKSVLDNSWMCKILHVQHVNTCSISLQDA